VVCLRLPFPPTRYLWSVFACIFHLHVICGLSSPASSTYMLPVVCLRLSFPPLPVVCLLLPFPPTRYLWSVFACIFHLHVTCGLSSPAFPTCTLNVVYLRLSFPPTRYLWSIFACLSHLHTTYGFSTASFL
jgi:hypothetical protein